MVNKGMMILQRMMKNVKNKAQSRQPCFNFVYFDEIEYLMSGICNMRVFCNLVSLFNSCTPCKIFKNSITALTKRGLTIDPLKSAEFFLLNQ